MHRRAVFWAVLAVLLSLGAVWASHRGPVPVPVVAQAAGHCVLPVAVMRREHMMLLRRVREAVVRRDVHDGRLRLTRCISCHAQRNAAGVALAVNARGQFCASCHAYVGVRPDCFACHAARPEGVGPGGFGGTVPGPLPVAAAAVMPHAQTAAGLSEGGP